MITVIDEPRDNIFEGMSMTDALDNAVIGVYEICNDFMMDSLLTEHAYLYENATEITYVNEDGSDNANGKSLKEKFIGMVQNFGKIIMDLFDKVIRTVTDNILEIRKKITSMRMDKKKIDYAISYLKNNEYDINISLSGWSSDKVLDKIKECGEKCIIKKDQIESATKYYQLGEVFKEIKEQADQSAKFSWGKGKFNKEAFAHPMQVVFDNKAISEIKDSKNSANKNINEYKKGLNITGSEYAVLVAKATSAIKSNTVVWKDICKAYNTYYMENAKIMLKLIKIANKVSSDEFKRKVKQGAEEKINDVSKKIRNKKAEAKATFAKAVSKDKGRYVESEDTDDEFSSDED